MKSLITLLCALHMFLCIFTHHAEADNGPSPAKAAYDKLVADQAAEREKLKQNTLKLEEERKEFIKNLAIKNAADAERARQKRLQEQEAFQKEQDKLDAQYAAEEMALEKKCGKDYRNLRVGMKLDRVQQCVAEYFLRGQVKTQNGVVDHYTRGDSWMYVKNGKVVAWGN